MPPPRAESVGPSGIEIGLCLNQGISRQQGIGEPPIRHNSLDVLLGRLATSSRMIRPLFLPYFVVLGGQARTAEQSIPLHKWLLATEPPHKQVWNAGTTLMMQRFLAVPGGVINGYVDAHARGTEQKAGAADS